MPVSRAVLVILSAGIALSAFEAVAQRPGAPPSSRTRIEVPAPEFQPRPAQARLQTLRRLHAGEIIQVSQLMTPFSLTPRTPYVEGRGSISVFQGDSATSHNQPAYLQVRVPTSDILIVLRESVPRRYLIDCTVSPGVTIAASTSTSSDWQAQSTSSSTGVVSFYTSTLYNPFIHLRDAAGASWPANQWYGGWKLTGCEITPVAAN